MSLCYTDEIRLLKEKIKLLEVPDYMIDAGWVNEMEIIDAALQR